jgi:hypothetical protein
VDWRDCPARLNRNSTHSDVEGEGRNSSRIRDQWDSRPPSLRRRMREHCLQRFRQGVGEGYLECVINYVK